MQDDNHGRTMPPRRGGERPSCCAICTCCCVIPSLIAGFFVFLAVYAFLDPVRVTVSDASLARFALLNNGTAALAYDLSLAVAVCNPNWAMHAEQAAPLDAELLFAGRSFVGARLADAGRKVEPKESDELRVRVVGETVESAAQVLGSDGVAELVEESVAGEIRSLDLKLSGEVRYIRPVFRDRYRLAVTCPLRLPTPTPTVVQGRTVVVSDKVIKCQ
ncbi:unnamed protein product [Urochloa decumbens]|uniref:Late embryogenesis abundant protein LEA-2 subgroup domain-containing protein n=1 Tax=Urochloa decumbens TaxID=240449 RepID=A0ABC9DC82_9POAL